jgi:NADPH-dependent curcumin reductase
MPVMIGGTVGEVVESKAPQFAAGDKVVGMGGWQQYSVVDASQAAGMLRKVDTTHIAAVGLPGRGGHAGRHGLGRPDADHRAQGRRDRGGQCGQRRRGQAPWASWPRRAAAASSASPAAPTSARYVVNELGFDACIDYKAAQRRQGLSRALKEACPNGIDGYFENVGGMILDAVMLRMNAFGRIAFCGMIAGYNGQPIPMANPSLILVSRLKLQGFIVSEHMELWPAALKELGTMVASGQLKYRETVAQGLAERARGLPRPAEGQELRQAAGQADLRLHRP